MLDFTYYMPTRVLFGAGKLAEIETTPFLPGSKALIVTSSGGSMQRSGVLARLQRHLENRGVESVLYNKITPNPLTEQIDEGGALARSEGCDVVIGLGGGSAVDASKSIALMATNDGKYWDYIPRGTGGKRTFEHKPLPVVAIPTTAGTGTESDPWTVVTRTETKEKMGFGTPDTFPTLSIVDPELMVTLPPGQTAYTGMDTLFHAVETYLTTVSQPASRMLSLEATQLVGEYLPAAVKNGADLEARTQLAWACTAAGICQSISSVTVLHVFEHSLSAANPDLPHGLGLIILSKAFFGMLEERAPEIFIPLAQALRGGAPLEGEKPFTASLSELIDACGLGDESLRKHGFTEDDVEALTQNVYDTVGRHFDVTPAPLSREDVVEVFTQSL